MRSKLSILLAVLLGFASFAKANNFGFTHFQIAAEPIPINYHVLAYDGKFINRKPVILFLQGSGPKPIFWKKGAQTTTPIAFSREQLRNFYFVIIRKPGMPFYADSDFKVPKIYHKLLNFNYRVKTASLVFRELLNKKWVDKKKIILVGISEGAYLAPRVAVQNNGITHLACFLGGGLSQAYDPVFNILNDKKHAGEHSEALLNDVEDYLQILRDINKDAESTTKFWRGHTYKMWSGFFDYSPKNDLIKLDIPIFYAVGSKDRASPFEGNIMVPVEFARLGKKNLTFEICRNCDHGFNEVLSDAESRFTPRFEEYTNKFFQWLNKQ
ncbi:MAG: hypothetical protein MJE63_12075 [Proteobacteria bacterium]|nr:hypothetical protein [Pseudomonadota bacterium]